MKNEKEEEEADYYLNDQCLIVFTEKYHLKRGYCCENGCKHCPYGKKNEFTHCLLI